MHGIFYIFFICIHIYIYMYISADPSSSRRVGIDILFFPILPMLKQPYALITPRPAQTAPVSDSQILSNSLDSQILGAST